MIGGVRLVTGLSMMSIVGSEWTKVLSKGSPYGSVDVGESEFNRLFWASPHQIVKRLCPDDNCEADYREMYYRRYTATSSFAVYDYLKENWSEENNVRGKDFGIFSSYDDAVKREKSWF